MKKKKKACCLKCRPAKLGLYRNILADLRDYTFVDDPEVWLEMLKYPNCLDILLDDGRADTLLLLIRDSFIRALSALERTLEEKLEECGGEEN